MPKAELARTLHFDSLDELLAEAQNIAEHPDAQTRGNWSASQNIWHVARYIQASVEGYPFKVPWYMKLVGPLIKNSLINKPMKPGYNAPKSVAKEMEPLNVAPESTTMDNAMQLLTEWVGKAKQQGFIPRNPAFGAMDRNQWTSLHCRHGELHFGLIELPD